MMCFVKHLSNHSDDNNVWPSFYSNSTQPTLFHSAWIALRIAITIYYNIWNEILRKALPRGVKAMFFLVQKMYSNDR